MSLSECCKAGFQWDGTPVGAETTLSQNKTYVTGSNNEAAVLLVHDAYGWTLPNNRLLADHYAKEANVTAYLPDFLDGEIVDPDVMTNPAKRDKYDWVGFTTRHSKQVRRDEIFNFAKTLRSQYKKVGAIGFCWGAWGCLQLGAKGNNILDCVSVAHPSVVEKFEIENLGIPTQILAPEIDHAFTPELKQFSVETLPKLGIPYEYAYFPGVAHGFAVRGDQKNPAQKDALERAKNLAVNFFKQYLSGTK